MQRLSGLVDGLVGREQELRPRRFDVHLVGDLGSVTLRFGLGAHVVGSRFVDVDGECRVARARRLGAERLNDLSVLRQGNRHRHAGHRLPGHAVLRSNAVAHRLRFGEPSRSLEPHLVRGEDVKETLGHA